MASTAHTLSLVPKTLIFSGPSKPSLTRRLHLSPSFRFGSSHSFLSLSTPSSSRCPSLFSSPAAIRDSSRSGGNEPRETITLPGCDYNHWLIVMEFPKDPAPTREQMIDTYLNTLATVLGSMEEAKKNMYAFSTTTYTGFQCTVSEETSEKFKGLPGVLWVLPDSFIDVKNKDYGGDKYVNGEIIPSTFQVKSENSSRPRTKFQDRKYTRRRDGPPQTGPRTTKAASESASS